MTRTTTLDREAHADRLLRAAARHTYDPQTTIDWDLPAEPGLYYCAPERVSIYGTPMWDSLSEAQRIELSKHEVASIASVGIWFEMILMQMLLREMYDQSHIDDHARYSFTELADECRHSMMFGRMIRTFGCPDYRPTGLAHALARFFKSTSNTTVTFAGTMYVEEILDAFQQESMNDETLQPLGRQVARLHVMEEARHIRFAREETMREVPQMGIIERAWSRFLLATVAYVATTRLINPRVYEAVGLDPREAAKVARNNPYHKATRAFSARKVMGFFKEQGLLSPLWARLLLKPAGILD